MNRPFIIPVYMGWTQPYYTIGLTIYDLLSRSLSLERSLPYSRKKTLECIPTLKTKDLKGGVIYQDGQFDDTRFEMAKTVEDILTRRTKTLFSDAKESVRITPKVAKLLAQELGHNKQWEELQISNFNTIAANYILN